MRNFVRESAESRRNTSPRAAAPAPASNGQSRDRSILHLQRTAGNGAVQRMLRIDKPGVSCEREADRLAEQVTESPASQHVHTGSRDTGEVTAPPSVHAVLRSPGQPLDPATRAFMEPRFGHDFSEVRVHSDAAAAKSARDVNAHAYTFGQDIVFGAGRFVPHTREGQRLIAHELTHVVQKSGAHRGADPGPSGVIHRQPGQYYEKTEADVAESVVEALQTPNNIAGSNVDPAFELMNPHPLPFQMRVLTELFDRGYFYGLLGYLAPGTKASRGLIVAIRFTQCQRDKTSLVYEDILEAQQFLKYDVTLPPELRPELECLERERVRIEKQREEERRQRALQEAEKQRQRQQEKAEERFTSAFEPGSEVCRLKKGVMQWHLYPATSAEGTGKKQRIQIKFLPDPQYRNMTITFLQTVRDEGGSRGETTVDIGMNTSVFNPFYGVGWGTTKRWVPTNEGADVGFRSRPNSPADPAAYMFDEPYFFPPPHGRVFESVAVVLETGQTLGALTWGVGAVPAYAEKPTCADRPSADYQGAVDKFYTPKSPAPEHGRENYDLVFDGFAPDGATLTADQNRQLDAFAAYVKEIVGTAGPDKTRGHLVVAGFGDSKDTDPLAASDRRAQAIADFLTGKGVPRDTLDLRPYGATWARYEATAKRAQEGGNRRVQIRMFRP